MSNKYDCTICGGLGFCVNQSDDCIDFEKCQCAEPKMNPLVMKGNSNMELDKIEDKITSLSRHEGSTPTKQNNLVISLPRGEEGISIRAGIKKVAAENHRSVSNQVSVILRDFLRGF